MMLHEIHTKESATDWNDTWDECPCSYCVGKHKLHYGLNIPQDKSFNSWWIIKYWNHRYIRWTFSFLKK